MELGPSPLAIGDPNLSVAQARAAIEAALQPLGDTESLALSAALGRVLAADIVSPIDVPAHDNSAMDGYAFFGEPTLATTTTVLRVAGTVHAGAPFGEAVAKGEAVRITTGAVMPAGLDTVVPHEQCMLEGDHVRIEPGVIRRGDHRRLRGEDLASGRAALYKGRVLKPSDLGLLASLGIGSVRVVRKLRVALFSTGNELRSIGDSAEPGSVYDSNRYSLIGALQRLGVDIIDLGIVRDEPEALLRTMQSAVTQADVVLTSGGVSMGDADYTREILSRMGQVAFWKVAMRPGRPFAFGPLRQPSGSHPVWLFALPGNPVAALVTFYVFARDALLRLGGASPAPLPMLQARCTGAIRKRPGRTEFQRAIVERAQDGKWDVRLAGSQGAGVLRSMSEANALLVLGHEQGSVAAGEYADVWLFDGLI